MDQGQLPISIKEVEALILQLYHPGASEKAVKTQEALQQLQRSPEGWQLANSLLGSKEEQVRFFGALTFIVKLNTDSKSLAEDDAGALLQNLVKWLIQCLDNAEGPLVTRKLCSTLVAYFIQFSLSWTRCVKHLMYCLCVNKAVPYHALNEAPETALLVRNISHKKATAILWFAESLVEEVGKTDSNSMKQNNFHRRVVPNVDDIVPLIAKYVAVNSPGKLNEAGVREESMRCFQAWFSYSHRAFIDDGIVLHTLQDLTKPAILCLVDDDLYEITIELFSDVLSNYSDFLRKDDFSLLYSLFNGPWAQARYERLIKGDFEFDSVQFGLFMIAFGDATVRDLAQNLDTDTQSQQFLSALCGLLSAQGFAVSEDKIFVPALEFWNTFVETMIDFTYSFEGQNPPWFSVAEAYVMQAIEKCWHKIQFPPLKSSISWDSADQTGFKDARRDFSDLLQQFYVITGIPILSVFINRSIQSTSNRNWAELEASFFCLAQYRDCIANEDERDKYLDKVFDSSLFSSLKNSEAEMLTRTMQTFLTLIDGYADYFERHPKFLPSALNLVFAAVESPILAKAASRSIVRLCSSCRIVLTPEVGAFLQQYRSIAHLSSVDSHVKEAIMQGISSIIQAIPDEKSKLEQLEQLLQFVEVDVQHCLSLASLDLSTTSHSSVGKVTLTDTSASNFKAACELGLISLRCLTSIARGLQSRMDIPVDLEKKVKRSPLWTTGRGSDVQRGLFSMVSEIYNALHSCGDIVEASCFAVRAGFFELQPGPFVFPPDAVVQFFLSADLQTPRIGFIISTACSFVSAQSGASRVRIDKELCTLLAWVSQLLQTLGEPSNDPEVAQNGVDFLSRLVPTYLNVFLNQPPSSLEYLFIFSLKVLTGSDRLPKSMAADFWSSFIALSSQEDQLQIAIDNALHHLGPYLAKALVYNIGGNAARSELDMLAEPLKKLVVRQVRSKSWLEAALLDNSFPSDKISEKDKLVFLQKVMNLRGARGTNQVVRDFWLSCRGTNFAYAS